MKILIYSFFYFALAFIIHFVSWKIKLPKRQTKTLLVIFFSTLFIGFFITNFVSEYYHFLDKCTITEYLHISLFFVALTLAYMITYSAIEVDSPSLVMIMTIANAGANGLDKNEFERILNDDLLVKPRLKDIVTDKMAYLDGEKYKLTSKGILFARIFIIYRKLVNAPKGG